MYYIMEVWIFPEDRCLTKDKMAMRAVQALAC